MVEIIQFDPEWNQYCALCIESGLNNTGRVLKMIPSSRDYLPEKINANN
jgi:hypothetical protein